MGVLGQCLVQTVFVKSLYSQSWFLPNLQQRRLACCYTSCYDTGTSPKTVIKPLVLWLSELQYWFISWRSCNLQTEGTGNIVVKGLFSLFEKRNIGACKNANFPICVKLYLPYLLPFRVTTHYGACGLVLLHLRTPSCSVRKIWCQIESGLKI